jgi:hypothetical protein
MSLHVELIMRTRILFFTSASIGLGYSLTVFLHDSNDLPKMRKVQWLIISDNCLRGNFCFICIGCITLHDLEIENFE